MCHRPLGHDIFSGTAEDHAISTSGIGQTKLEILRVNKCDHNVTSAHPNNGDYVYIYSNSNCSIYIRMICTNDVYGSRCTYCT